MLDVIFSFMVSDTFLKLKFVYEQNQIKRIVPTVHLSYRIVFNFRHF